MKKVFLVVACNGETVGSIRVFANKKNAEEFAEIANKNSLNFTYIVEKHTIQ